MSAPNNQRYDPRCEPLWEAKWGNAGLFEAARRLGRPKWFVVELPPFANGRLHLGHVRNYVICDVAARFHRAIGDDVLYTTGFDAFGLPNENAAREAGVQPAELVAQNIPIMKAQLRRLGLSHDWSRALSDHDPNYYRWVQWVFLRLFEEGYAFRRRDRVNWCTTCHTTLADSLAENGRCWRCQAPVRHVEMDQWFIRETGLVDAIEIEDPVGWPEAIRRIHRDWIGRKDGFEVAFRIEHRDMHIRVFVSEPGELAGCAFVGVAADHALARQLGLDAPARNGEARDSGETVVEPGSNRRLPLILMHDRRMGSDGTWLGRPDDDKLDSCLWRHLGCPARGNAEASQNPERIPVRAVARRRLRDWDIARPRYWGTPVPIVHCPSCGQVPVPDHLLPVLLPQNVDMRIPGNPLEHCDDFVMTQCPRCLGDARRDTHTLEAYSSPWWYYLICRDNPSDPAFGHPGAEQWMPVDLMVGGSDQARTCFFHLRTMAEALTRLGIVDERRPVRGLLAIGMVKIDGQKMSKSRGNSIDPAALIDRYGADALRLAVLSAAAPDQDVNWSENLVVRAARFLSNLIRFFSRHRFDFGDVPTALDSSDPIRTRLISQVRAAERNVTISLRQNAPHVAVRQIMFLTERILKFASDMEARGSTDREALAFAARELVRLLSPIAPHAAEELWSMAAGRDLIAALCWPVIDDDNPAAADAVLRTTGERASHEPG